MDVDAFLQLIDREEVEAVDRALAAEPELVGAAGEDGATALHRAVRRGSAPLAALLLERGAVVDAPAPCDGGRRTPLHDSYECGHDHLTELLLANGADYDINVAAARGDRGRVDEILDRRPELVDDASTGLSPLGWAGYGRDPAMVGHLVGRGATLGDELCCPCGTANTAVMAAFLAVGADPDALSPNWGARPLHVAAAMPYSTDATAAVELLLAAGADPAGLAADGTTTPLALARRKHADCDPTAQPDRWAGYASVIATLAAVTEV